MIKINNELCDLCGICLAVCPQNCLEIIHFTLKPDQDKCISCNICVGACPLKCLEVHNENK